MSEDRQRDLKHMPGQYFSTAVNKDNHLMDIPGQGTYLKLRTTSHRRDMYLAKLPSKYVWIRYLMEILNAMHE